MSLRKFLLLISLFLFSSFVYFSYLVSKEVFQKIDFDMTVKLQDHLSRRFDFPFSLLSIIGTAEVTVLIWLVLLIIILLKRYWLTMICLLTFFASVIFELFGKVFVFHPGPPRFFFRGTIGLDLPSHYVHTNYSYPSGHLARTSFLISFLVVLLLIRKSDNRYFYAVILIFFLMLMFISRVYLGEHWFSDVVGGMLLGSSLGIFTAVTIPSADLKAAN